MSDVGGWFPKYAKPVPAKGPFAENSNDRFSGNLIPISQHANYSLFSILYSLILFISLLSLSSLFTFTSLGPRLLFPFLSLLRYPLRGESLVVSESAVTVLWSDPILYHISTRDRPNATDRLHEQHVCSVILLGIIQSGRLHLHLITAWFQQSVHRTFLQAHQAHQVVHSLTCNCGSGRIWLLCSLSTSSTS